MIGKTLYRINHIPLADDYNRVVDAVRPFQNISVGGTLDGRFTSDSINIIGKQSIQNFNYPFKTTTVDTSALNVQFGRVFEVDATSGYTEIEWDDGAGTFDVLSGIDITFNSSTSGISGSIDIAINKVDSPTAPPYNFIVDLASNIATNASYYSVQKICNFTVTSGVVEIEQVLVGSYAYSLNNESVSVKESVEYDTDGVVHLVGDEDDPGVMHYYGTSADSGDPAEHPKGFYDLVAAIKDNRPLTKESIEYATDDKLHLVGDEANPGSMHYYGTSDVSGGSGIYTKGFYDLVEAIKDNKPLAKESIEYATDDKLHLVGDENAPGNNEVYSTDATGDKGWEPLQDMWERLLVALSTTMVNPDYVLCKKTVSGTTTYGWAGTVTHSSQHPS